MPNELDMSSSQSGDRPRRYPVILILLGALAIRVALAYVTPAWEAPDEYAHYWYAEQLLRTCELPVSRHEFPAYQAYQPPLYYFIATALIHDALPAPNFDHPEPPDSDLVRLRLLAAVCGVLAVLLTYLMTRKIPELNESQRLTATAVVAFLPTFVGVSSTVNNDALVTLLCAACLVVCFRPRWSSITALLAGLLFGLAILTKLTALAIAPVIVWPLWRKRDDNQPPGKLIGLVAVGASLGVGLLLWRNLSMYHSLLAVNPGLSPEWSFSLHHIAWAIRNLTWSFWLAFGRTYNITPSLPVYIVVFLPLMLGALLGLWRARLKYFTIITISAIAVGTAIVGSLAYTLSYPMGEMTSWGKNLFPVLPLIAVLLALGWRHLTPRPSAIVSRLAILILVLGDLWALWRLIEL